MADKRWRLRIFGTRTPVLDERLSTREVRLIRQVFSAVQFGEPWTDHDERWPKTALLTAINAKTTLLERDL